MWPRLKVEELEQRGWPVFGELVDAQHSTAAYFDYNHGRHHSSLPHEAHKGFTYNNLKRLL